jgi:putative ABC transport system permease protein
MLKNYLIVASRIIFRSKIFSLINIMGLAVGMACSILIFLWIKDELNYDNFHEKAKNIHHVYLRVYDKTRASIPQPTTSHELANPLKNKFTEILNTARMGNLGEMVVKYENKLFIEPEGMAVDPSSFEIFTFPFVKGNPNSALESPYSIVLTEAMANKYFGNTDPVGKSIRLNNKWDFTITGIVDNVPSNSYIKFDFLVPFNFLRELGHNITEYGNLFNNCAYYTYVLLQKNVNYKEVSDSITSRFNFTSDEISGDIFLVPLIKTHRFGTFGGDLILYVFSVLGVLILLIACFNFVNLSTARSVIRSKEVAVRKIFGAKKRQLRFQFLGETLIYVFIALSFAIILVNLILPSINLVIGKELVLNYLNTEIVLIFIGIIFFSAIFAGVYPAIVLSSFNPLKILTGLMVSGTGKSDLRKILVTTQFAFAILFLVCILLISKQFNYMDKTDLGFKKEHVIYIRLDQSIQSKSEIIETELNKLPGIKHLTTSSHLPMLVSGGYYQVWGSPNDETSYICETRIGYDYVKTLNLEMANGRFFSRDFPSDLGQNVVVNETAIRQKVMESPIGEQLFYQGDYYTIIGVMKDFHHVPLIMDITPLIFRLQTQGNDYLLIKLNSNKRNPELISYTLNQIEKIWEKVIPEFPFQYEFLENFRFEQEKIMVAAKRLIEYFTFLAIFISCLGLLGLSTYMAEQRTKEIGIRKSLGASVSAVIYLFSRGYIKLLLIANLISLPIAYFIMRKFLQVFAYKINLNLVIFAFIGFLVCVLAILTIGYQAYRSAIQNPAETLRYE